MATMAGLSFEQLVIIADELCARTGAAIVSYPALAAIAGATAPKLHGVPVYRDPARQARGVSQVCRRVGALSQDNDMLASVVCEVLAARGEEAPADSISQHPTPSGSRAQG